MTGGTAEPSQTCSCGSGEFEDGFIDDVMNGRVRWIARAMEIGMFGNAKRSGPNRPVLARRCVTCSRLHLFAGDER